MRSVASSMARVVIGRRLRPAMPKMRSRRSSRRMRMKASSANASTVPPAAGAAERAYSGRRSSVSGLSGSTTVTFTASGVSLGFSAGAGPLISLSTLRATSRSLLKIVPSPPRRMASFARRLSSYRGKVSSRSLLCFTTTQVRPPRSTSTARTAAVTATTRGIRCFSR